MEYDEKLMDEQAKNLENFLYIIDRFCIIEGLTESEYNDAVKGVKKFIKKLKKHKGDEVYNTRRYGEYMEKNRCM